MLNQEERNKLGEALTEIAIYFGHDFPKEKAIIYINILEKFGNFPLSVYLKSVNKLIKNGKRSFPTPFEVLETTSGNVSETARSLVSASKIREAIGTFGYNRSNEAKAFLSATEWSAIRSLGGWNYLCENLGTKNMPVTTFFSQARDLMKALYEVEDKNCFRNNLLEYDDKKVGELGSLIKQITKEIK